MIQGSVRALETVLSDHIFDDVSDIRPELFNAIPVGKAGSIMRCLKSTVSSFERGECIIRGSERGERVGLLLSGHAYLASYDKDGNRSIIHQFDSGNLIDGRPFASSDARHSLVLEASSGSSVAFFQLGANPQLKPCCMTYVNQIKANIADAVLDMNADLLTHLDVLSKRSTRDRLMTYLSEQAKDSHSNSFHLECSRQELADLLCVDRSAMSRELCRMQKEGIISFARNDFVLNYDY